MVSIVVVLVLFELFFFLVTFGSPADQQELLESLGAEIDSAYEAFWCFSPERWKSLYARLRFNSVCPNM